MLDRMFNQPQTISKWDKLYIGFVCGIFGTVLGVLLFYFAERELMTFGQYIASMKDKFILSPLLSLGCVVDAFIFFLFLQKNCYNAARGVILAMFLWAIPIIWAKFF